MSNIALLIPSLRHAGGAEKLVDSLTRLLSAGHHVVQISFDEPGAARYFASEAEHVALGPVPRLPLALRWITYVVLAWRLRRAKQAREIHLTISCLWGADLISALSGGRDKKFALGLINVVGNPTNRLMIQLRAVVAFVYRRFDRTLCISRSLADELAELYELPSSRIGVFRNFLEVASPTYAFPNDGVRRYVFCGRMVHEKNVDGLLTVWAAFSCKREQRQLVVIGDGPLLSEMKTLAAVLGLSVGSHAGDSTSQVLFLGSLPQPQDFMVNAYAFLLPSRHEGVPTVLILALSLGLPILAADCHAGGVRETLELDPTAVAGRLLPIPEKNDPHTVNEWVAALADFDDDNAQRDGYSSGALKLAQAFDITNVREFWMMEIEMVLRR
ncbi:MAG: glycosyltransferase [Casimicrobium sp.]